MRQLFSQFIPKVSKPVLFALYGAIGCFLAAILGEIFLGMTLPSSVNPVIPEPQVDVMFVLDVTSSMNEEIEGVQRGIQNFAREISDRELDGQVGLIAFGDRFIDEKPQLLSFNSSSFTKDTEEFSRQVGELTQVNGGDAAESSLDAIALATAQPFRNSATKVILLMTDAPPKIPDWNIDSLSEVTDLLANNNIDQLHLVVNSRDVSIFQPLQANAPGEVFLLSDTVTGRQGFETVLPVVGKTIAQETIKGLPSNREFAPESASRLIIIISVWTGILALGIALALIMGQNRYLHRRILSISEGFKGSIGGLIAGVIAGAVGQLLFVPVANIPLFVIAGRIISWMLLGLFLGGGMSFVVPNLKLHRALQGGAVGGLIGAIAFSGIAVNFGDIPGRLMGATIIGFCLGLAIALIEQLTSKAWLIVHWTPREKTQIALGAQPIILGSSDRAHIYLPKARGYAPITAKIFQENDKIVMQFPEEMRTRKKMKILRQELVQGDKRKLGDVTFEVKIETSAPRLAIKNPQKSRN